MFNKIVVALDTNENHTYLFEKALSIAQSTGAALRLISVLMPDYGYGSLFPYYPGVASYPLMKEDGFWDAYQQEYANLKEENFRMLSQLSNRASAEGVATAFFQESGEPGPIICDLASSENADLIIVGTHGRRGIEEFLVGSISSYVTHRAQCSVLVVRDVSGAEKIDKPIVKTSVVA